MRELSPRPISDVGDLILFHANYPSSDDDDSYYDLDRFAELLGDAFDIFGWSRTNSRSSSAGYSSSSRSRSRSSVRVGDLLASGLQRILHRVVAPLEEWTVQDIYSSDDHHDHHDHHDDHDGERCFERSYWEEIWLQPATESTSEEESERGRQRVRMLSARQLVAKDDSRRRRGSKAEKERARAEETPEERDARREERRKRKEERTIRKAAEAEALLGISRIKGDRKKKGKGKAREHSPHRSHRSADVDIAQVKQPKLTIEELISGVKRRKHSDTEEFRKAVSPKREVRAQHHVRHSSQVISSLNDSKGSTREDDTRNRNHSHHDHSTVEAASSCGRCLRKQQRREERRIAAEETQRLERSLSSRRHRGTKMQTREPASRPQRSADHTKPQLQKQTSQRPRKEKEKERETSASRQILGFAIEKKPSKLVTCVTCLDNEIPKKEAAKLACDHWFCNECLKRLFTLSLTDPAHMPPTCCTADHIPLEHVDKLLTYATKKQWNQKYLEYTTSNRIYCPTTDCGEWIRPENIHRSIGKCTKCKNKCCAICNGKAHSDEDCPKDPEMLKFMETATANKYQRCYSCRAVVELEKGCNHMTCTCTAEFCYVCGLQWKTCNCPWFNWEPESDDEYPFPEGPEVLARRNRREQQRAAQVREDEELARRLARDLQLTDNEPTAAATDFYELPPAMDPITALGTFGIGLRNGIRRLAADYVEAAAARAESPPRAADRNGFLSENQQAHIERFLRGLDVEEPPEETGARGVGGLGLLAARGWGFGTAAAREGDARRFGAE